MRNRFNQTPIIFDDACNLPGTAQLVYRRLYSKLWGESKNVWNGSYPKLAQLTHLSIGTVFTAKKQLVKAGLIAVDTLPNKGNTDTLSIRLQGIDKLWELNLQYCSLTLKEQEDFCQQHAWETLDNLSSCLSNIERQKPVKLSKNERNLSNIESIQASSLSNSESLFSNIERQKPVKASPQAERKAPTYSNTDITTNKITDSNKGEQSATTSVKQKKPTQEIISIPLSLENFDLSQPATIKTIMQLGDILRGNSFVQTKRSDSKYQRALVEGATPLSQRARANKKKGYTLQEIVDTWHFLKREAPDGKPWLIADDWWIGKSVDLWVVANNIDKMLDLMAKLEKQHNNQTPSKQQNDTEPVLWTRHTFDGAAVDHWWLFEYMPLEEAFTFDYIRDIFAPSVINEIDDKLEAYKAGKIQLPKEAYATVA